ncbi:carbohydrate ABC transporter permease [Plantibacter flavus]|uniref:carbohydrate ABC transporter permease n=1 Tax=Plantibacter flavus TaxID=150123 RepID=UPI003F14A507
MTAISLTPRGGGTRHGSLVGRGARIVLLLLVGVAFAAPLFWLVLAPTKTESELTSLPPLAFGSFENVGTAWNNLMSFNDGMLLLWLTNSIAYSVAGVIIAVVAAIPAGYALAMYSFRGRQLVLTLTLIGMILPTAATVIPIYRELALVGLTNTAWAVILPSAFFPFGVYLTYLHFQTALPRELVEAAKVDGASELRVFLSLGLPLAKPAVALVTFFAFVATWNNYFLPYVMLVNDKLYTLQLGIATLLNSAPVINASNQSDLPIHKPEAALAALVAIVPIAIFFFVFQRFIGTGMLSGAVKE